MNLDMKTIGTALGAGLAYVAMKKYGKKSGDAVGASAVAVGAVVGNMVGQKVQAKQSENNLNSAITGMIGR